MVSILATADWQLGKLFGRIGADARQFREQLFLTAEYIINELAPKHDIVLIMGDTFDRPDADWDLIERVSNLLKSCKTPIHIIPGNHDYWHNSGVLWALKKRLEDSPHIVIHSEQNPYHEKGLGMTIYPGVLRQRNDLSDRTSWITQRDESDGIRVGMFHESIQPIGNFDPNVSKKFDLDLSLLGDWHGPKKDIKDSLIDQPENKLWYAGSPEAQKLGQPWQGRVLSIEVELGKDPVVEPIYVGKLRFQDINFEFTEEMENPIVSLSNIIDGVKGDATTTYIRLQLTGELAPTLLEELEQFLQEFSSQWPINEVDLDNVSIIIGLDDVGNVPTLSLIEKELLEMKLSPTILARSILLLRKYYRRLA
jgi:DNA repair exonuclease SbcCD nuclease subunit